MVFVRSLQHTGADLSAFFYTICKNRYYFWLKQTISRRKTLNSLQIGDVRQRGPCAVREWHQVKDSVTWLEYAHLIIAAKCIRFSRFGITDLAIQAGLLPLTIEHPFVMNNKVFSIQLPHVINDPAPESIENHGVVVIIGANGSGKTRLGSWIELHSSQRALTHRISAQKSLNMPDSAGTTSLDRAESHLLNGYPEKEKAVKNSHRWSNKPNTTLLNDFEQLMVYLFSEASDVSTKYLTAMQASSGRIEPPIRKVDIVKRIWESVIPHRELVISGGKLEVRIKNKSSFDPYNGSEMSDGERVLFYLIGQCLAAIQDGIIVIDEPELHLHKSLQASLWDAIEAERPDCQFVYITHDLDFAVTRVGAPKVCIKSYDGVRWDWYVAAPISDIPEEIVLQIIGSRKPVLFVEGNSDSLDQFIFRHLYPHHKVVPLAGCQDVIRATSAFRQQMGLHVFQCSGIVDRDNRTEEQVNDLQRKGIFVLGVSEIENLLLLEDVIKLLAHELKIENPSSIMTDAKRKVFEALERDKEIVISRIAGARIRALFLSVDTKNLGPEAWKTTLSSISHTVDVDRIFTEVDAKITDVLQNQNYDMALQLYPNKGLTDSVGSLFGLQKNSLVNYVKRLLTHDAGKNILMAIRPFVPQIESSATQALAKASE